MATEELNTFRDCFSPVEDPRIDRCKKHNLLDIIGLCLLGVICGCDTWVEIEEYGEEKLGFLQAHFGFKNGIPSHDTIGRVMSLLDPIQFNEALVNWTKLITRKIQGEVIAIDGKAARGSSDANNGKKYITMVSAWAKENGLCLAHHKVTDKSNEIHAIPELLKDIDITDCIVTIDAMGTQKEIAKLIKEGRGDYILALKGNHGTLYEEIKSTFNHIEKHEKIYTETEVDKGHGRIEKRTIKAMTTSQAERWMVKSDYADWQGLEMFICVESERIIKDEIQKSSRYYLASLKLDGLKQGTLNASIRSHWSVENSLHWSLDVTFREDYSQVRTGHADQNFSTLRKVALNLLKKNSRKASIKRKRLKAGWNNEFLIQILNPDL